MREKSISDTSTAVNIDQLQKLQDAVSEMSGMAVMVLAPNGEHLTVPSGLKDICRRGVSATDNDTSLCDRSHRKAVSEAATTLHPVVYRCHAGFSFFALPVIFDNAHVATVVAGQALLRGADRKALVRRLADAGMSADKAEESIEKSVKNLTPQEFRALQASFDKFIGTITSLAAGRFGNGYAEISLLHGIAGGDNSPTDVSSILDKLCNRISEITGIKRCAIIARDRGRDGFVVSCSSKLSESFRGKYITYTKDILFERRFAVRGAVLDERMDDITDGSAAMFSAAGISKRLTVPLTARGMTLGLLELYPDQKKVLSADKTQSLVSIASQVAVTVDNAFVFSRAGRLASVDGLTGLKNFASFNNIILTEIKRAKRYKEPLSLLMIDIDDFNIINEKYGHLIGNMVLTELAGILYEGVRDVDTVARFGGEEFVVVLPETPADGAFIVAERLRVKVFEHDFPGPGMRRLKLTTSIGVAECDASVKSVEDLIMEADRALLRAKALGKDRVVKATPSGRVVEKKTTAKKAAKPKKR